MAAILDVQKSLCIAFLTISDQCHNFYFCEVFLQNGCRRPFWMSENHLWSHFWPLQIKTQLKFWLPSAILDVRNSLWITFLAILDQYRFLFIFYFFTKWLWITFLAILDQYRFWNFLQNGCRWPFWMSEKHFSISFLSISHRYATLIFVEFFEKWLTSAILDVRISLLIAFLAISDRYATLTFFEPNKNGWRRPFWMSEIHFRSHFWPFQIDRPFWISEIHFRSQFWPFQIHTELLFFFLNC